MRAFLRRTGMDPEEIRRFPARDRMGEEVLDPARYRQRAPGPCIPPVISVAGELPKASVPPPAPPPRKQSSFRDPSASPSN